MTPEKDVTKDFCNERHANLDKTVDRIDKNVQILFTRLNWFYILTIGTLVAAVSAALSSVVK